MEFKIQPMKNLRAQMIAVVRGEQTVPRDKTLVTFESTDAVVHYLSQGNECSNNDGKPDITLALDG